MALDLNSMFIWWPWVERLGLPAPKTILVPEAVPGILNAALAAACDEGEPPPEWRPWIQSLVEMAAESDLRPPWFVRTDLCSAKHQWGETCAVDRAEDLSVDFARLRDGSWRLLDMAVGEQSWHPEDCPERRGQ